MSGKEKKKKKWKKDKKKKNRFKIHKLIYMLLQIHLTYFPSSYKAEIILKFINYLLILIIFDFLS